MNVPIAADTLGTIGAICWSVQLIPQIIINYRRHHTTGLQPSMMLLWASAGVPLGVYNITENFNVALRVQAQILTVLSLITWSQCYYYGRGWSWQKCAVILIGMCILMGGIEAALIFALRVSQQILVAMEEVSPREPLVKTIGCEGSNQEKPDLACNFHGSPCGRVTCSWCTAPLLGHLYPSNSQRYKLHFCGYRCCWRSLFINFYL